MFAASRDAFELEVMRAGDVEAAIGVVAREFSADEPMSVALGVTEAELVELLRPAGARMAADGLTIVARDAASGDVAGVLITDDFTAPLPLGAEGMSLKFEPVFDLLGRLDEGYREGRSVSPGEYLHLFILATDARYRGRGIAGRLVRGCLANGERLGYRQALTEATGLISQSVFRAAGFAERLRAAYRDNPAFAGIEGHEATLLMDRAAAL